MAIVMKLKFEKFSQYTSNMSSQNCTLFVMLLGTALNPDNKQAKLRLLT